MNSYKSALPKNFEVQSFAEDPIVKEVRDARHALAERFGNNLQKLGQDIMSRQHKAETPLWRRDFQSLLVEMFFTKLSKKRD